MFHIPTGSYGVGVTDFHVIDYARVEINAVTPTPRELMLHIWYPTKHHIAQAGTPYDADACESTRQWISQQSRIPRLILRGLCSLKTYAVHHAPCADSDSPFPVILMSHGTDTMVQHYTWLGEELASHGYVVVGINHPYMASVTRFPDGRVVKGVFPEMSRTDKAQAREWKESEEAVALEDIKFVIAWLEQEGTATDSFFAGKLDMQRLGMIGHSRGGRLALYFAKASTYAKATADRSKGGLRACQQDARIKAVVNLDGASKEPITLTIPALFVFAEKNYRWHTEKGKAKRAEIIAMQQIGKAPLELYSIPFAGHSVFTDLSFLLQSSWILRFLSRFLSVELETSSARGIDAIQATSERVIQFFGKYLR